MILGAEVSMGIVLDPLEEEEADYPKWIEFYSAPKGAASSFWIIFRPMASIYL
jgi:hypothetical protein